MDYFTKLNTIERIETMRLALETLVKIKKLPKIKGDAIREIRQTAETFAIYLAQKEDIEQPVVRKDIPYQKQLSADLARALEAIP